MRWRLAAKRGRSQDRDEHGRRKLCQVTLLTSWPATGAEAEGRKPRDPNDGAAMVLLGARVSTKGQPAKLLCDPVPHEGLSTA